jgi:hypothetical protein
MIMTVDEVGGGIGYDANQLGTSNASFTIPSSLCIGKIMAGETPSTA